MAEQHYNVIVIGAGAAGLLASWEMASAGLQVLTLEARNRVGGRMHTGVLKETQIAEIGAEFVHGELPISLGLLDAAGLEITPIKGKMLTVRNGRVTENDNDLFAHWELFAEKFKMLETDMTVDAFLKTYFADDRFTSFRNSVQRYASGFDGADTQFASIKILGEEWLKEEEEEETQFRIENGYSALAEWLQQQLIEAGAVLKFNEVVESVEWDTSLINVQLTDGDQFTCDRLLVTIPLNHLQTSSIRFTPALPIQSAFHQIGCGHVLRVNLLFTDAFWFSIDTHLGFAFGEDMIPTWWTRYPSDEPIIVGWVGGPDAEKLSVDTDGQLVDLALKSLGRMLNIDEAVLQSKLVAASVGNWKQEHFTGMSYSYATPESATARNLINKNVESKIFFAGEAFYEGDAQGTVEAAFDSGQKKAREIIASLA